MKRFDCKPAENFVNLRDFKDYRGKVLNESSNAILFWAVATVKFILVSFPKRKKL